jgi:uncharacterized protein (DUF4415 family)
MTPRKRVATRKKVAKLHGSARGRKRSPAMPPDWAELYKPIKKPVTLRLDADILAWFQRQGRGYQTRINRALRQVMMEERK